MLVERGQNLLQPNLNRCLWTAADLPVGCIAHDAIEPGSEGGFPSERVDLPHHAHERVLDDFLGILRVARDPDSQAIRAFAVSRDEPVGRRRLAQPQCIDELLVAVGSDIGGAPEAAGVRQRTTDGVPPSTDPRRASGRSPPNSRDVL